MAGTAYALTNSLSLNDVRIYTAAGDITMGSEGALVVKKASGAATAVTLPAHPADNLGGNFRWVIDGKGDAASNNITISAASGNINGAATYVISENYGAVLLFYPNGGTEWLVAGAFNLVSATELGFLNGITAGTPLASKAVVLDANSNVSTFGQSGLRITDIAPLAATGSALGNAAAITHRVSIVSGADNAVGVILPVPTVGDLYIVYSSVAANGLKVYPQANSTINDGSANAAYVMEGKTMHFFLAANATNWIQMGLTNS